MKAYLTSIGEATEQVCKSQLERFGFEVVLLNEKEPWIDKYKKFIEMANEDCIRIDADIVPNKHIKMFENCKAFLAKAQVYDLYRNEVWPLSPVYYSKNALEIIKDKIILDENRPETWVCRFFPFDWVRRFPDVVGVHGWGQDKETVERAKQNKINRGQISEYDFDLYEKIKEIK